MPVRYYHARYRLRAMSSDELRQQAAAFKDLQTLRNKVPFEHRHLFADVFRRLGRCIPTYTRPNADSYDQQRPAILADTQRILLRLAKEKK